MKVRFQNVSSWLYYHLDEGVIVGEKWFDNAEDAVQELNGSSSKRVGSKIDDGGFRFGIKYQRAEKQLKEVETLWKSPPHLVTTFCRDCGKTMVTGLISMGIPE